MISYAQNGEDVVLERLFCNQLTGFYIDVGAADPTTDSVTKHFYDRGWHGINIEPSPHFYERLCIDRQRDINLQIAISDRAGLATLYLARSESSGLSTLHRDLVSEGLEEQYDAIEVKTASLATVCREHVDGPIDFLKVDVEGHELIALQSADWVRNRPRVLVIEATEPNQRTPSHSRWEHVLKRAGYCSVLFDGLNRFYVDEGDLEARSVLAAPANVHDGYIRSDAFENIRRIEKIDKDLQEAQKIISRMNASTRS